MKKIINKTHIEGFLYEADLQERVTGEKSKNPGTPFIMGTISLATDDAMTNVIPIHFTYVTATTSGNKTNATYTLLKQIADGELPSVMKDGADKAVKLRIDSALGLNEFYSDRSGGKEPELVSAKRNEGGFLHKVPTLSLNETDRNTFECDMLITGTRTVEADAERNLPEKVIVKGAVFDFRGALLPVEFSVLIPGAMAYFEGLGASSENPVFTKVKGVQVSETVIRKTEETSAWGTVQVKETPVTRKDWVITWALETPYPFDDESSITAAELTEAMANREIYLAGVRQRYDEYQNSKGQTAAPATVANKGFNF